MKKNFLVFLLAAITLLNSCSKSDSVADPFVPVPPPVIPPPVIPPSAPENGSLYLGNPSGATDNENNFNDYLVDEGYYALSYSRDRGIANWVSWHVMPSDHGTTTRQDDFRMNEDLPANWYRPDDASYTGYGFDRGHFCPSADRTATVAANSSTFLMSNIFPQAPVNNQVTWANLENYCRNLVAQSGNELYIIAGAYGAGGTGNLGYATSIDNGRITVPATLWKVIVVLPNGSNDLARITTSTRVIAVSMPNENSTTNDWKHYRVSVDEIEHATGYDLLDKISQSIEDAIEAQTDIL